VFLLAINLSFKLLSALSLDALSRVIEMILSTIFHSSINNQTLLELNFTVGLSNISDIFLEIPQISSSGSTLWRRSCCRTWLRRRHRSEAATRCLRVARGLWSPCGWDMTLKVWPEPEKFMSDRFLDDDKQELVDFHGRGFELLLFGSARRMSGDATGRLHGLPHSPVPAPSISLDTPRGRGEERQDPHA
jgi:hypothetical protein